MKKTPLAILTDTGKEFEWTTKDGRRYPLSMVTDSHLYNIYKYVRDLPPPKPPVGDPDEFLIMSMFIADKHETMKARTIKYLQAEAERRWLGELF